MEAAGSWRWCEELPAGRLYEAVHVVHMVHAPTDVLAEQVLLLSDLSSSFKATFLEKKQLFARMMKGGNMEENKDL